MKMLGEDIMLKLSLSLLIIAICSKSFSQDTASVIPPIKIFHHILGVSFENGWMIGGSDLEAKEVAQSSYYNGLDLKFGWSKNNANDIYNRVYRFPIVGVGYYTSTFHNATVGNPNAVYFFFEIPFELEGLKKWTFSYTGAFGLSYNFNAFDSISNKAEVFIGSRKNCYVHLGFLMNYHLNDKFTTYASIGYKHFSNGSMKLPNKGINLIPVSIGLKYSLSGNKLQQPLEPLPLYIKHNEYNIMAAVAQKNYEIGEAVYYKYVLGFNYLRQVSYKHRLGVGVDFFYSTGAQYRNISSQSNLSKSLSYAIVASGEWVINEVVSVPMGFGVYLHRNEENRETTPYYERVGLRFRIAEHYNLGLTIKAHGGVADVFEWTVAYTFRSR